MNSYDKFEKAGGMFSVSHKRTPNGIRIDHVEMSLHNVSLTVKRNSLAVDDLTKMADLFWKVYERYGITKRTDTETS